MNSGRRTGTRARWRLAVGCAICFAHRAIFTATVGCSRRSTSYRVRDIRAIAFSCGAAVAHLTSEDLLTCTLRLRVGGAGRWWYRGPGHRLVRFQAQSSLLNRVQSGPSSLSCTERVQMHRHSCCWGHGLRQMEAYAAMDAEMDIEKARIAREAEALAAQGRGHMQGSRGPLAGIANRILRV